MPFLEFGPAVEGVEEVGECKIVVVEILLQLLLLNPRIETRNKLLAIHLPTGTLSYPLSIPNVEMFSGSTVLTFGAHGIKPYRLKYESGAEKGLMIWNENELNLYSQDLSQCESNVQQ